MSLVDNTDTKVFPTVFIKECIEVYVKRHKTQPKILVISREDIVDYLANCTMPSPKSLGLERIIYGEYLQPGEIDLAMGIK